MAQFELAMGKENLQLGLFLVIIEQAKTRLGHEPRAWVYRVPGAIWAYQKTWAPGGEDWAVTRYVADDPATIEL